MVEGKHGAEGGTQKVPGCARQAAALHDVQPCAAPRCCSRPCRPSASTTQSTFTCFHCTHALLKPPPLQAEKKKRVRTRRGQSRPAGPNTPLDDFFAEFPEFDYNSRGSATHEFERMCDYFHWCKNDPAQKAAHRRFKDALVLQFNETYGTDVNSLRSWQALAEAIGIDPIPETLKECRAVRGYMFRTSCSLMYGRLTAVMTGSGDLPRQHR